MNFLTLTWLSWMAGTVSVYWLLPAKWRDRGLMAISLAFMAVYSLESTVILVTFTGAIYYLADRPTLSTRRLVAIGGAVITVLVYYKIRISNAPEGFFADVAIPLGLSYYSFRLLHYLLEKYKGALPAHNFEQFASYLLYLPTIVVGPIHRFAPFLRDQQRREWDGRLISQGLERILYGYVKIAVLGNYLVSSELARFIAGIDPSNVALRLYLEIVQNGLNLYFQFSGFSDIAIGFGLLLGYRVMENFNWPYLQKNISDFWRCWHISLTSWCREYVYVIVFSVTRNPYLAAIATLLVIGLWHDISLQYLLWGAYHGVGIVIWQLFQRAKPWLPRPERPVSRKIVDGISIAATVHFVWFGFVLVWQPNLVSALGVYRRVLFFWI